MFSIINIVNFFMVFTLHGSRDYLKIAHRGYSEVYKDNSVLSFQKAIENNFDAIEMDLQLSKDQQIVLHHDAHIDNKYIYELDSKVLQKNYDIITLDTFFKEFKYRNVGINFDLKGHNINLVKMLLDKLKRNNIDETMIYISSYDRNLLQKLFEIKNKNNHLFKIGFISSNSFTEDELNYVLKDVDFFTVDYTILTNKLIKYCHDNNIKVFTYTNKNIYTLDIINRYDVDGVFSDCKFPDINQI